ncbi:MAG: hypothetical protein IJT57_00570 [Selenomonadaceae bacterium]|nr:hypothetical protein [Selenomonadaceae bacterium]
MSTVRAESLTIFSTLIIWLTAVSTASVPAAASSLAEATCAATLSAVLV